MKLYLQNVKEPILKFEKELNLLPPEEIQVNSIVSVYEGLSAADGMDFAFARKLLGNDQKDKLVLTAFGIVKKNDVLNEIIFVDFINFSPRNAFDQWLAEQTGDERLKNFLQIYTKNKSNVDNGYTYPDLINSASRYSTYVIPRYAMEVFQNETPDR